MILCSVVGCSHLGSYSHDGHLLCAEHYQEEKRAGDCNDCNGCTPPSLSCDQPDCDNEGLIFQIATGKHFCINHAFAADRETPSVDDLEPTVTGSRGSNAALASLLTALAGLGLLTDSSS